MLSSWGVDEILINLHHRPEVILSHVMSRKNRRPEICFSFEPQILGTGGALRKASWFLDNSPFWLINGDILAQLDPAEIINAYNQKNVLAATWLTDERGPRTVRLKNGIITAFHDHAPCSHGTYTFCGLQLVSAEILRYIEKQPFSSIIDAYKRAMRSGKEIAGVSVENSFWADMGTPEAYLECHDRIWKEHSAGKALISINFKHLEQARDLSRAGIKTKGFVCINSGARISAGARIHNSVVMNNVTLLRKACLDNAIVSQETSINGNVTGVVVPYSLMENTAMNACLQSLGWNRKRVVLQSFEARGSQRSFYRMLHGGQSVIVVLYDPARRENSLAVRHARFLRNIGINVPSVVRDIASRCVSIYEDIGDSSLLSLINNENTADKEAKTFLLYRQVLDNMFIMHKHGSKMAKSRQIPLSKPFTESLYRWERDLFDNFFLRQRLQIKASQRALILNDISSVSKRLCKIDRVLLHRDLQSSNVIFKNKKAFFIDYQGMRMGPAVYDLASLLCDPYVMLPETTRMTLLEYYAGLSGTPYSKLEDQFWAAAVQRLVQALGAFARLASHGPTSRFASHIPNGVKMLDTALSHLNRLDNAKKFTVSWLECEQKQEIAE